MHKTRRAQRSGDEIFRCLPGKKGLIVASSNGLLSLPDGKEDQVLDQPALPMGFIRAELAELCHPERPAAITHFGPASQDKESNQDFAISALIHDSESRPWRFAAVADGVSGKTFWPERSSRIACLSAYHFFREWISDSQAHADQSRDSLRLGLVKGLSSKLRNDFREDKGAMGALEKYVPSTCSRQHYRDFQSRPDLWYNSTLLVAALGPRYGVVLWAGDGGLWIRKEGQEPKTPLRTGSGMVIDRFVSLEVQPGDFKAGLIHCDRHRSVSVALASDGLDRTLQQNGSGYGSLVSEEAAGMEGIRSQLEAWHSDLFDSPDQAVEADNSSIAWIHWVRGEEPAPVAFDESQWLLDGAAAPVRPAGKPMSDSRPGEPDAGRGEQEESATPAVNGNVTTGKSRPAGTLGSSSGPPALARDGHDRKRRSQTNVIWGIVALCVISASMVGAIVKTGGPRTTESAEHGAESVDEESEAPAEEKPRPAEPALLPPPREDVVPEVAAWIGLKAQPEIQDVLDSKEGEFDFVRPTNSLLAAWMREAAITGSESFTVIAYADRDQNWQLLGRRHCEHNLQLAKNRADRIARLLQDLVGADLQVHSIQNVCGLPAGVQDFTAPEARRLELVQGRWMSDCACEVEGFPSYRDVSVVGEFSTRSGEPVFLPWELEDVK